MSANKQLPPAEGLHPSELREIFRKKLRFAVNMVGSVNKACALIGVNRTQFNRYLSGQSMPRPELLYKFCQQLSLPMEWFFDQSKDFAASLSEHELGGQLRQMVAGHKFRISEEMMPDGFYLLWKKMFDASWPYDAALCTVKTRNDVKTLKVNIFRRLKAFDEDNVYDRSVFNIEFALFRSANGIFLMSIEGEHNHVRTFFIRLRAPVLAGHSRLIFSGVGLNGAFGGLAKNSLVPVALERVPPTMPAVLAAGRTVSGYQPENVPRHIKAILDEADVPRFVLK